MLEGQELSGERMDRRTRCRQYRIDLSEWTQLPTEGLDLLSGHTGDWLRIPDAYDGGSHSLRWLWACNESGDQGGVNLKVSCSFTHPIIRVLKTTLLLMLLKKSSVKATEWIQSNVYVRTQTSDHNI